MSKVVVIAGGTTGLGKEVARQMVGEGHAINVLSPFPQELKNVSKELGCETVQCDISDREQVHRVIGNVARRHNNRIDVMVNSAALWSQGGIEDVRPPEIERAFAVNVFGAIWLAQAVVPYMEQGGGRIINVASLAALNAKAERSVYCGTKAALKSITEVLALELAPRKINVSAVHPGPMRTGFYERQGQTRDMTTGWLNPEQAAKLICFIAGQPPEVVISNTEIRDIQGS